MLGTALEPLYAAYRAVKRARDERAPLDLDIPERKIVLTAHNTVDRVMTPERLDSHRLIEEFMILANVAAAETLERGRVPLIYRVHDEPDMERVNALREFLKTLDISLPKAGALRAEQFNHILQRVKGHEAEKLVNEVVLRTQAQAEYAAENYGHFGLNLRRYAHFTSPIRRYADLVVHRGLIRAGKLGDGGTAGDRRPAHARRDLGGHLRHRTARDEGRTRNLRPAARALPRRPGRRHLPGPDIGGVTRAGLFVKLDDTGADGFIPARTIGNEYFRYQEDRHAMIGDTSGETYRLGDTVTVKLVEAAPVAGALRFELLSEGRYDGRKPAGQRDRKNDTTIDKEERDRGGKRRGKSGKKRRR